MIPNTDNSTINQSAVFQIPDAAEFLWTGWEDSNILYDLRSGHTQMLNDFAREILALIEDQPRSINDLSVEFGQILEIEVDQELENKIVATISEFDNMGIIESVQLPQK